ncbi:MAG: DNA-3-methyladenine glycosylase [Opitutaceae bacterium]
MANAIPLNRWKRGHAPGHARGLLGKHLLRRREDGTVCAHLITEVEAYDGARDLACHAAKGRTARTDILYAPGGIWYVYLCYGIHEMLNLVVGPRDWPAAILIRGLEGVSGPGRVTRSLQVDRRLNRRPALPETGLWIEDWGVRVPRRLVRATPRIGVDYAGPVWAAKPWRFIFDPQELARVRRRRLPPPADIRSASPAPSRT